MINRKHVQSLSATALITLACGLCMAKNVSEIETGLLTAVPGIVGSRLGAKVLTIDDGQGEGTVVHVDVPIDPKKVDTVEVYDTYGNKVPQISKPDLIKDYEDNRVGVKLHLDKKQGFEFRLRLIDTP